jgi:UDP-glucose 4-epimerase
MRVVVVGATGNIGTSVLQALEGDPEVSSVIAVARRPAASPTSGVEWRDRDVTTDDLRPDFEGADAVICLAWLIQPSRDLETLPRAGGPLRTGELRSGVGARQS